MGSSPSLLAVGHYNNITTTVMAGYDDLERFIQERSSIIATDNAQSIFFMLDAENNLHPLHIRCTAGQPLNLQRLEILTEPTPFSWHTLPPVPSPIRSYVYTAHSFGVGSNRIHFVGGIASPPHLLAMLRHAPPVVTASPLSGVMEAANDNTGLPAYLDHVGNVQSGDYIFFITGSVQHTHIHIYRLLAPARAGYWEMHAIQLRHVQGQPGGLAVP